ncbi:hypothetical protein [Neobacillus kokaensis]|uniref:Uncharacterized protein n=1 Tax=Neobacillus kokaensis TaxID=2759023 RepID=A0ABQ3N5R4_9BACI|nr:hypothetical protein [Neobacillus kokaensis]GHI00269.1 hypothetical protein AM1BK_38110 [Neobacillus kokaensis]
MATKLTKKAVGMFPIRLLETKLTKKAAGMFPMRAIGNKTHEESGRNVSNEGNWEQISQENGI